MSSPSSPYREVGIEAFDVATRATPGSRKKKAIKAATLRKLNSMGNGVQSTKHLRPGHDFQPQIGRGSYRERTQTDLAMAIQCRYCGQPKFAVDGIKCKGKKK